MSAHRYQATWRSITFNRVYDDSGLVDDPAHLVDPYRESDYRLHSLDITGVQAIDYRELRQHLEGAEANQAFEGVRQLVGRGVILANSPADLEDKTWAMYEAFSPAACRLASVGLTPPGVLPFDFKRASGEGMLALRAYARPAIGRPIVVGRQREGLSRPFLFGLVALDPRIYAQAETTQALNGAGVTTPVTNYGNTYTHPTITIVLAGAGDASVVFTNQTTGGTFTLNLSGEAAGTLLIDTARSRITKAGVNDYAARSAGFLSTFHLATGVNTILWTGGTNVSSVSVAYRDAYA